MLKNLATLKGVQSNKKQCDYITKQWYRETQILSHIFDNSLASQIENKHIFI